VENNNKSLAKFQKVVMLALGKLYKEELSRKIKEGIKRSKNK